MAKPSILILTGPTASGKSSVALQIAQKHGGVIINADSQQMYRELSVLTARPTAAEEANIPHRLYGSMSASEACSAGKWLQFARMEIDWALSQKKRPILVGGTGLYLKALMEGIAAIPDIAPEVRAQARSDLEAMGNSAFHERLLAVDPELGQKLKVSDRQRISRAYEVWLGTGKPLSWWQRQQATPPYAMECFEILRVDVPRDELYHRCDARFTAMLGQGAVDEVKQLLALRLSPALPAMKSVGVPEITGFLEGKITLDEAAAKARQATRNYAKRQLTWLKNQLPEHKAGAALELVSQFRG